MPTEKRKQKTKIPPQRYDTIRYPSSDIGYFHLKFEPSKFKFKGGGVIFSTVVNRVPKDPFSDFCYAVSILTSEFYESPWKGKLAVQNA